MQLTKYNTRSSNIPAASVTQACSCSFVFSLSSVGGIGGARDGERTGSAAVFTTLQNCKDPIDRRRTKLEPFMMNLWKKTSNFIKVLHLKKRLCENLCYEHYLLGALYIHNYRGPM